MNNNIKEKPYGKLIQKKYQAWKLLASGVLLSFVIFILGRFYLYLQKHLRERLTLVLNYKEEKLSGENWLGSGGGKQNTYSNGAETVIVPMSGGKMTKAAPYAIDKKIWDFVKKFHYVFLLVYILIWLLALSLILWGVFKYLKVRQEIDKLKASKSKEN